MKSFADLKTTEIRIRYSDYLREEEAIMLKKILLNSHGILALRSSNQVFLGCIFKYLKQSNVENSKVIVNVEKLFNQHILNERKKNGVNSMNLEQYRAYASVKAKKSSDELCQKISSITIIDCTGIVLQFPVEINEVIRSISNKVNTYRHIVYLTILIKMLSVSPYLNYFRDDVKNSIIYLSNLEKFKVLG